MDPEDMQVVRPEGAFTLDVQIYVSNGAPDKVQTVTLCNVLSFVCRCPICDKSFQSVLTLKSHLETHEVLDIPDPTKTDTEGEKVGDDSNYTCVASVHSGEQHFIFITQEEDKATQPVKSALSQIRKRAPQSQVSRKYPCALCDLTFPTRTKLNIHNRIHTGEKPFECETCGKRFVTRGELTVHVRIHTGDKPYTCVECGTCHRTRSSLHGHIHRYHQEKAYSCPTCEKKFAIKSYFQAHLRIHDEANPFRCQVCEKSFAYQSFLDKHMKTHEGNMGSPEKDEKPKRRSVRKAKKQKTKKDSDTGSISTEEKEKIAVQVLQQGRAAGDASSDKAAEKISQKTPEDDSLESSNEANQENGLLNMNTSETDMVVEATTSAEQQVLQSVSETLANLPHSTSARVLSTRSSPNETVLEIETIKNGEPETIYVTLAETDLDQVAAGTAQLTVVQEDTGTVDSVLQNTSLSSKNIQFVSDPGTSGMVVVESPLDLLSADANNLPAGEVVKILEDQQAAVENGAPQSPAEYARRVDAVVQELEKRINTSE